jgi:hypothetical protein|tara:strand:- start:235 stop:558 length:324 start_codon:yes stop_codon:yes gene_type:complete
MGIFHLLFGHSNKKDKVDKNEKKIKSLKKINMIEYSATRLTFKKDLIEQLNDGDYIKIHVIQDNATYKMTKREFYQTFYNVVNSKSYKEIGSYNYPTTPNQALKYLK